MASLIYMDLYIMEIVTVWIMFIVCVLKCSVYVIYELGRALYFGA